MTTDRGARTALTSAPPTLALPDGLGLAIRPFSPDVYGPMAELMRAAFSHDGIPWRPTAEDNRLEIEGAEGITPTDDIIMVEADGLLVAQVIVERTIRDGVPTYECWGQVHPDWRGRGIGSAILDHGIARAAFRAAIEDPGVSANVRTHVEETQADFRALLATREFTPIRHFFLMRRADLETTPDVSLPAGFELRRVAADQHRAIFEAESEAFQDHWGAHAWTEHDFIRTFESSSLDTALWVVAWDGDSVAGVVENWIWREENETLGVQRGWLEKISVRRAHRRQGLGRAITAMSLARLRDAGMSEAMLGVDAANPTGALDLYEGLGFEVDRRSAAYERQID